MKDWFYFFIYFLGWPPMFMTSSPTVLHRERSRRKGPFILVCNHLSAYDVACLIKETPRVIDFVSIVELFRHPLSRWFLTKIGAFPSDRWKIDSPTVRTVLERLGRGRVIGLFPEGNIRTPETSVLNGGKLKAGVGRIAKIADVPIVPCVLVGARAYHSFRNWVPLKLIKYGLIYGEPIVFKDDAEVESRVFEERLRKTFLDLHAELKAEMVRRGKIKA